MKLLTAKEARELADESREKLENDELNEVLLEIVLEARKGGQKLFVCKSLKKLTIDKLIFLGFKVRKKSIFSRTINGLYYKITWN